MDRAKNACMLCRRQFPSTEVLQKHISMSDLHKVCFRSSFLVKRNGLADKPRGKAQRIRDVKRCGVHSAILLWRQQTLSRSGERAQGRLRSRSHW